LESFLFQRIERRRLPPKPLLPEKTCETTQVSAMAALALSSSGLGTIGGWHLAAANRRRRLAHPAVSPADTARTFFPRACYPFATDSLEQT
jgi:hypothetical protein